MADSPIINSGLGKKKQLGKMTIEALVRRTTTFFLKAGRREEESPLVT